MNQWVNWKIEYQVWVFWYQVCKAWLRELMLNHSASAKRYRIDSTCILEAEPDSLDIKRHSPSILYICVFVWMLRPKYRPSPKGYANMSIQRRSFVQTCTIISCSDPNDIGLLEYMYCASDIRPRGYKTFFMLNSPEHEIYPANKWAVTRDFQQCGILTSVDSDEPVQPPFKLRNLKWDSVSS